LGQLRSRRREVRCIAGYALADAKFVDPTVEVSRRWIPTSISNIQPTTITIVCGGSRLCSASLNPIYKHQQIATVSDKCQMIPSGSGWNPRKIILGIPIRPEFYPILLWIGTYRPPVWITICSEQITILHYIKPHPTFNREIAGPKIKIVTIRYAQIISSPVKQQTGRAELVLGGVYLGVSVARHFVRCVAAEGIVRNASGAVRFVEVEKQDAILVLRARKQGRLWRIEIRGVAGYALGDAEFVDPAIEIQ